MKCSGAVLVALVTTCSLAGSTAAQAQVGYPPERSPYNDLEYHQDVSAIVGYYHAKRDPVNVAPQSAPMVGLLYAWRAGGPVYLTGELDRISSNRRLLDPTKSEPGRDLGTRANALYDVDLSLALALTGFKSWHELQPIIKGGLGMVSDFKGTDPGGFDFGTRFAFSWGGGVRLVSGGRVAFRADINNRLYTISYPQAYYNAPTSGGGNAILTTSQPKSLWTNNTALTIGISYQFSK